MPFTRYTAEQLHKLRESPLCIKPDGLPAIEQWMEQPQDQNSQRRKQQNGRGDDTAVPVDGAHARQLFPPRQGARTGGDELFLGPPTTKFNSARNLARNGETQDKNARHNGTTTDDHDRSFGNFRKPARDHDDDRPPRDRNTAPGRRSNTRDAENEGWSTVKPRRSSQNEEGAERWRGGDRSRRETEDGEEQPRRNGLGRGARMGAWRDEQADSEGNRPVGRWRDRERERERELPRDRTQNWPRGQHVQESLDEEPEWMNEPVTKAQAKEERTQEDFERWKAEYRVKSGALPQEKDDSPVTAKEVKVLAKAPILDSAVIGSWNTKKPETKPETVAEKVVPLKGLGGKTSKFGSFFKKEETPPSELAPEPAAQSSQTVQLAEPLSAPKQARPLSSGPPPSKEDSEGFARILQMLDSSKIGSPAPNAAAGPGLAALFSHSTAPENVQRTAGTSRPDNAGLINELLARHTANRSRGPQTATLEGDGLPHHLQAHADDLNSGRAENTLPGTGQLFSPAPMANGRQRPETPADQKRDLLLKLIEGNRANMPTQPPGLDVFTKSQASLAGGLPRGQGPQQLAYEESRRMAPSAPPSMMPPGLHDMFSRQGGMPDLVDINVNRARRAKGPPAPPAFFDEGPHDPAILGIPGMARRNTTDPNPQLLLQLQQQGYPLGPPSQAHPGPRPPISNMGIPTQNAPMDNFRLNLAHNPSERSGPMPPPGFAAAMRPPPGFQPPPPHLQSPNGHPAMRGMPPSMFPGHPAGGHGQMVPPHIPGVPLGGPMGPMPPSYFAPPPGFQPNEFYMRQQQNGMPGRGGPPPGFPM